MSQRKVDQPFFAGRVGGNQAFSNKKVDQPLFAGRIGGNQAFVASSDSTEEHLIEETRDAAPLSHLKDVFDLSGFFNPIIWRAAVIEFLGTGMLVFIVGMIATSSGPYVASTSLQVQLVAGLTTWIAVTLLVYACGPVSGGHLNPLITMGTFAGGLSTFPRSVIYVLVQSIGSLCGAFMLKLGLGGDLYYPGGTVAGCSIDTSMISNGQAFVLEFMSALTLLFIAFGVGLDPRQSQVFGPAYGPVLVGLSVGLVSFASAFTNNGWAGASLNPARCFGLMAANLDMHAHWIHWLSAFCASSAHGLLYYTVPPYTKK